MRRGRRGEGGGEGDVGGGERMREGGGEEIRLMRGDKEMR